MQATEKYFSGISWNQLQMCPNAAVASKMLSAKVICFTPSFFNADNFIHKYDYGMLRKTVLWLQKTDGCTKTSAN